MTLEQQVLDLPASEKLKLMEAIWGSLTEAPEAVQSPDWHKAALAETAERYRTGKEEAIDWESAKKQLRSE